MGHVTKLERAELEALGATEVDHEYAHYSVTLCPVTRRYHDLMKGDRGWYAVTFNAEDTGSRWESPPMPTVSAAFVYGELNQWGT